MTPTTDSVEPTKSATDKLPTLRELCEQLAMREFELDNLKNENVKLRELVKKLVILAFARCANCDLLDASCALVSTQKCLLWNECESIARELGVEVDDG